MTSNKELYCSSLHWQPIIVFIFHAQMSDICWFQFLKCENVLFLPHSSHVIYTPALVSLNWIFKGFFWHIFIKKSFASCALNVLKRLVSPGGNSPANAVVTLSQPNEQTNIPYGRIWYGLVLVSLSVLPHVDSFWHAKTYVLMLLLWFYQSS